jgi:hypothetical protein
MISQMNRLPLIALIFGCLISSAQEHQLGSQSGGPEYGTVNVLLAQKGSVVVVTDSMLTQGHEHNPIGFKLYRIDDRTICAMAGFYSNAGPNALNTFAAFVPSMIQDVINRLQGLGRRPHPLSFSDKAMELQYIIEFELTNHLQAIATVDPNLVANDSSFLLELTMAGYDLDGSLQIAEITLAPSKTEQGFRFKPIERPRSALAGPPCESTAGFKRIDGINEPEGPVIREVGESLFCDIAGIPDVAEELLAHPSVHSDNRELEPYAQAATRGTALSLSELRALALFLVDQTGAAERRNQTFRVGGAPQIAVLTGGRVVETPSDLPARNQVGSSLLANQFRGLKVTCPPGRFLIADGATPRDGSTPMIANDSPSVDVQAELTDCTQPIDGIVFHDSSFTDSIITFSNAGPLLFGENNAIIRTSLRLSPSVDIHDTTVHKLICGFKWEAVYKDSKKLDESCP